MVDDDEVRRLRGTIALARMEGKTLALGPDKVERLLDRLRDAEDYASSLRADLDRAQERLTAVERVVAPFRGQADHLRVMSDAFSHVASGVLDALYPPEPDHG